MSERLRVMIVDDEPDIPAVLKPILELDFEVVVASNGLDALLKLPRHEPDVMVVDVMMPLMDGWELARNVRRNPEFEKTPIIFLTALDSREDIRRGYAAGATVYITKPFDPERVRKNVQSFAEHDRLEIRPKKMTIEEIRQEERQQAQAGRPAAAATTGTGTDARPAISAEAVARPSEKKPLVRSYSQAKTRAPVPPAPAPRAPAPAPAQAGSASPQAPPGAPAPAAATAQASASAAPWNSPIPRPPATSPLAGLSQPPRVMVVDDDPEIVDVIRMTLEHGFEVITACDGLDALNKIPIAEPDIYVIDGMMPKMSGFQLLQMLRGCAETRRSPVLFISAKSEPKDREYARSLGANQYLSKPFLPEEMVQVLEAMTQFPGFSIRAKRKNLDQILLEEGKKKEDEAERERRKTLWKTYEVLEDFLRRHGEKNPL